MGQKADRIGTTGSFRGGEEGYDTFRIPAMAVTAKGTLLAFCEARKHHSEDWGDIDVVLKRSTDGGQSWSEMRIVADAGSDTIGNPCVVVDRATEIVWLFLCWNKGCGCETKIIGGEAPFRTVWVTNSRDDGLTWSEPLEISGQVRRPNWTWYATGPGHGLQMLNGRLIIPCNHVVRGNNRYRSHIFYSDNQGQSWCLGGTVGDDTNECQAVELHDGTLYLNMRSLHGKNTRAVAFSKDGGESWSDITFDDALIEPVCQASILRCMAEGELKKI